MSPQQLSTNQPGLFADQESPGAELPASRVKSARSLNRAASWEEDVERTAAYLMGQARTEEERALIERFYNEALAAGPDFINHRGKSEFRDAPKLKIDRNAFRRILNDLDAIERGTYWACRKSGKQGLQRTAARVLKALLSLAWKYGKACPSLDRLAHMAGVCKQTVVNCLKTLEFYGFIVRHRRIKRIPTPLGSKVVQDTNAYTIQEAQGPGALAAAVFRRTSESKKCSPSSTESLPSKSAGQNPASKEVPDGVFPSRYEDWAGA